MHHHGSSTAGQFTSKELSLELHFLGSTTNNTACIVDNTLNVLFFSQVWKFFWVDATNERYTMTNSQNNQKRRLLGKPLRFPGVNEATPIADICGMFRRIAFLHKKELQNIIGITLVKMIICYTNFKNSINHILCCIPSRHN